MTNGLLTRAQHLAKRPALPLVIILALGIFLRLYNFPTVPVGLDRDELSAAYEGWSLLTHGTDRWGNAYPVYFLSWGSGQNVLYSYLSLPWIALFGLTSLAARLTQVIFAILALPLMFLAVRRVFGRQVALIATLLLAVAPWGWLQARWGIESNLTPFFLLLTVYCLLRGLGIGDPEGSSPKHRWIIISLLPAALSFYAYGLNIVPVGILLLLTLVFYRRGINARRQDWLVSALLFLIVAAPFIFFFIKNYLPRDDSQPFPLDGIFPFTFPQLFVTRLTQVQLGTTHLGSLISNLTLVFHGFSIDKQYSDTFLPSPTIEPVPILLGFFALLAIIVRIMRSVRNRRWVKPNLFDLWAIGFLPLFALFPMSTTESQGFVVPWMVYGAYGIHLTYNWLAKRQLTAAKVVAAVAVVTFVGVNFTGFFAQYQTSVYTKTFAERFSPDLDKKLPAANKLAVKMNVPLYVSPTLNLGYMYTLWYLHVPATEFDSYHPTVLDPDFGRYRFLATDIHRLHGKYVYLQPKATAVGLQTGKNCPQQQIVDDSQYWRISVCTAR